MPCHGKIIVIKRSGVDGTHFPLTATTCLFGRKSECDIRIQLPHVSKEHCKVEVKEKEVFVSNLSSVNPTQLNGHALKQTVRLKHGDIITIIDRSFRFESSQPQGRRRSAGLDSENFKLFVSNQSEDTNETVRIESITNKVQRKSEGNLTRATHTRRSLQASSSDAKGDHSPFGELYKMLKSEVEPRKKGTSQTPAKESSPKNANIKRNLQAEEVSPATSRRNSRSQSGDSATVQSQDIKVDRRSVSADPVREQSKSPLRGPRTSLTKQKQGSAVKANSPISSNKSVQNTPTHEEAAQSPRRMSGKQVSSSQEQEASVVSPERQSPRRSRSAGGIQVEGLVTSPASSSPRRSRGQSVPQPTGIENQENSPLPIQSPRGRRSGSKDQTMGSPSKPVETEENVNKPGQGLAKKSPRKRRSDELGLAEPPLKRKRVSFGGHLSPELFDKRLPPNSPLKKGATPARRSLSLNSPRTVIRKSFGLKQTVIREVFEASATRLSGSPLARSTTPTRRISAYAAAHNLLPGAVTALVSSPKRRSSAVNKSPSKSPSSNTITPVKQSPNKRSPSMALTLTPLRTSPSTRSQVISPSRTPDKKTPEKSELSGSAKRSSVSKLPDSAKKSPVKSLPPTPVGKTSVTISTTPSKRSPSSRSTMPVRQSPIKSEAFTPAKSFTPGKRSPGKSPSKTPAKLSTPGKRSPAKSPSTTPGKRSPGRPPSTTPAKKSPSTRSPIPVKQSPIKYEAATPAKSSTPGKRSPGRPLSATPAKKSPVKLSTSGKRSPGKSPSKTPAKLSTPSRRSPVKSPAKQSPKLPTPGKRSPGRPSSTPAKNSPAKLSTPGKRSPGRPPTPAKNSPAKLSTPGRRSPAKSPAKQSPKLPTPGKRSPGRPSSTPAKNSPAKLSTPGRRSPAKSPSTTPTKKSKLSTPGKRSPGRPPSSTPAKNSPAKLSTPGKRSPAKSPSTTPAKKSKLATPGKRSPGKSPAKTPAKLSTPAKKSHKLPTPGKRSPGRPPSTPAKNSPAKLYTPGKRSPGKTPAKLSTPGKRSLSKSPSKKSQLATPGKRSPGKSPAKLSTPVKRSPGRPPAKKSPAKLTPSKGSPGKSPSTTPKKSPASKSPTSVKKSPAKRSPSTPYTKGRFSISRVDTPPKFVQDISASKTPKRSRKSMTSKKTPLRRSRKLEAFEAIRARRRSGASEANLYVVKSWADVVKIGVAKAQKKIDKPSKKTVVAKKITKKKPKPKTPKRVKDLASTGHAESPATILIGRAHTRRLTLTGYVPKVVRNEAVKVNLAHNESFTGIAELFSTPVNAKQRRSGRSDGSKAATPKSTVEMSVIQTPEESDEMMVSPLSSRPTTQRKQYGRDAVSRLLEVSLSPELRKVNSTVSENAEQEASKSAGKKRESFGLTGVKRIMKTPKRKGKPVADPHALRKLLKTPKETESAQTLTRRSAKLEVLGIAQLVNQKGGLVEDFSGVKRILKTPKQRGQPVADYIGMKRIMRTPRERGQPVEDMVGIKRLMRTPKVRGQLIEDIDLSRLMSTPVDSTQSAENTRPIEEIFGMKNLVKTPPKKSAAEQALTIDSRNDSEVLKSAGASSAKRGRPSKRLSLSAETDTAVNEVQKTMAVAESEIAQESGVQSISEVIKSAHKKGRLSKNLQAPPESEITKSSAIVEATSPSLRGRPRTAPEVQKEPQASDGDVTSPVRRGRPRSTVLSPVADSVTLQADEGAISQIQSESSVSDVVMSASRRGRPRSAAAPKESVTEVTSPSRRGRPSSAATKESVTEVTSPSRRGTPRSAAAAPQESVTELTSPSRRGTPKSAAAAPQESVTEVTSPSRRGRPSSAATKESVTEVTSPSRRGTPRSAAAAPKESVTEVTSPSRRGRPSATAAPQESVTEVTSPSRRGRPSATASPQESVTEVTSPSRRGRPSSAATKESVTEVTSPSRRGTPRSAAAAPKESVTEVTSPSRRGRPSATASPQESVTEVTSPSRRGTPRSAAAAPKESVTEVTSPSRRGRASGTLAKESLPAEEITSPTRGGRRSASLKAAEESHPESQEITSPTRRGRSSLTAEVTKELAPAVEITSPSRRGRHSTTSDVAKAPHLDSYDEITSPKHRGRPSAPEAPSESVPNELTSPSRRGRSSTTTGEAKDSLQAAPEKITSPTRRGRPSSTAEATKESDKTADLKMASPSSSKKSKSTPEKLKESESVSDVKVISPSRRGRSVEAAKESVPVANKVASPTRRVEVQITETIPKELDSATNEKVKNTRGRPQRAEDLSKESASVVAATLQSRRGRSIDPVEVPKVSTKEPVSEVVSSRRGRPKASKELPKEPAIVTEEAPTTRRGRAKIPADVPEKVADVSQTRRGRPKTDLPEVPVSSASEDLISTRRGRPKAASVIKEPVPAESGDVTSPARRGRTKVVEEHKEPVPAANEASSPTRRGRPKTTDIPKVPLPAAGDVTSPTRRGTKLSEQPKEPVQAASDATSPTRRGKAKAAALVKQPVPKEKSDVSSPVRRGRTKVAEEQKEPAPEASDATSPTRRGRAKLAEQPQEPVPAASDVASTRRGRPKTADIPQEPVPAAGNVTSPTRRGRTKLSEQPKESVPATSDVSVPTRRGRPKTKGIPEKTVPDSAAISPLRSGRLQNSEESKESLPVTAEVTPPKRGGRSARATEKKAEVSDDATIMAKTEKRSVPRQTAKNRKQNVEELPQAEDVSQAVESNTTSVQPAPPRRGRGRKAVQNEPPTAAADVADPKPEETKLTARRRGQSKNLDETSKESDVPDHAKSPEAKSDKRSSKNQKAIQPVEEPTKNMRGRQSRTAQKVDAAETSISEVTKSTDSPQKSPAKGRSRARETSDVPAEGQEQVSKQRGRRKNQSANETPQVQTESRSTRGKRGLADSEQPQPVEIKKTTRGKASGESVGEEKPSKAKSVQWHPLLATNEKGTDEVEETATEAPSRGGRSKGRTKPDTSEPVSAKRSRRENLEDDKSVPPAISETNTASSKGKRGRKPAIPQEQVEEDKPSDKQSASETAKSLGKQALKPTRGRKAAASSKDLDSENNEVDTTVVPASRGRRGGTAASIAPAESTNQSPAKDKKQKKAILAKKSSIEAEEVAAKPARGVKRRNLANESNDNASANHADTESVPSVHGKRNARNTKAEKDQPTKESSVEKRMVSSPAKRRKTEAATSVTTTIGKSKQTTEHVEAAVVTKGRASTRSRK
ncbi:proliferation marker protein Ki-67 isoform X10 [Rana temporaria]|uniref:proliferation marker protein Ki-67 isoform X10 n=1 Tax=Rana temporaria TaxID=8407 RepID=UPI001AAD012F|nr:proliferation marker protein Ki-67 isoform X10 [Rana temporaria]